MTTRWTVERFSHGRDDTLGLLLREGVFRCFTLEDEHRDVKVAGETRIPEGTYEIGLRTVGGFHERYSARFENHIGMIEILDVPGFTDILIHCGNDDDDTAGCLLLGNMVDQNVTQNGAVLNSTAAYIRIYQEILQDLAQGPVLITYLQR